MIESMVFQQALLSSLANAQEAYEKANELDLLNSGENIPFLDLWEVIRNYEYISTNPDVNTLSEAPIREFILNLIELGITNNLPTNESIIGKGSNTLTSDFAKKAFLLIMANSILEKLH